MKIGWYFNLGDLIGSAVAVVILVLYIIYNLIVEKKEA